MADIFGNLWEHNLTKVIVVDVTDDYELMQPPLPSDCYPVLAEMYLPSYQLSRSLPEAELVFGYLYDWHETPRDESQPWVVGVVREELMHRSFA